MYRNGLVGSVFIVFVGGFLIVDAHTVAVCGRQKLRFAATLFVVGVGIGVAVSGAGNRDEIGHFSEGIILVRQLKLLDIGIIETGLDFAYQDTVGRVGILRDSQILPLAGSQKMGSFLAA